MPAFFAFTLFLSSGLLFLIQPLFARMALPLLGGTPAVWNTCMVFFQAALLAGYGYAHLAPKWFGARRHLLIHVLLMALPIAVLPFGLPQGWSPLGSTTPVLWLLSLLAVVVGLPSLVVATSAPLLQKWFAATGHPAGRDPYFLYAASNLGSMLALLCYPFLVEPNLSLPTQSRLWSAGYVVLVVAVSACALILWSRPANRIETSMPTKADPPAWRQRGRWILLAFVPSSLMLSVTMYLTTDIAAIPLLWVVPLSIYLLTFILVFARKPLLPHAWMVRVSPLVILVLILVLLSEATSLKDLPIWYFLALHLVGLFVVSMVCHGELANSRPGVQYLTEYYLWLSAGGVLGGLFNSVVAPFIFSSIAEYPLVLVLGSLLRPASREVPNVLNRRLDVVLPAALGILAVGLVLGLQSVGIESGPASVGLMFAVPAVLCYTFLHRPIRFGLGIGALLLAGQFYHGVSGRSEYRVRSFFGVHRVTIDPKGRFRELLNGSTVHGRQRLTPHRPHEPLTYYHRTGPIGQVFAALSRSPITKNVAIVGLGAGSLAAYGESGQQITYFEIDPVVEQIARNERYFTFLADCPVKPKVILGDARLTLQNALDHEYGLIILDAFSSDAIPLHLLTVEALKIYRDKLLPDGILAFHLSNRHLDLEPVLGDLAADAKLYCCVERDLELSDRERDEGKYPSQWLLMTARRENLGKLAGDSRWHVLPGRKTPTVWTDDFANIFSVFKSN